MVLWQRNQMALHSNTPQSTSSASAEELWRSPSSKQRIALPSPRSPRSVLSTQSFAFSSLNHALAWCQPSDGDSGDILATWLASAVRWIVSDSRAIV